MRIAFVRRKYNAYGGSERFLERLMRLLHRYGHEIHIFAERWNQNQIQEDGLIFHHVSVEDGSPSVQALSFASRVEALLKEEEFDVIHGFERCPSVDLYRAGDGCHRAWLHYSGKFDLAKNDPYHRTVLSLEEKLFRCEETRLIVCVSKLVKSEIQNYYQVPDEKLRVLYSGIDLDEFNLTLKEKFRALIRKNYGISDDALVILFVGSSFERKGLTFLLQAFQQIRTKLQETKLVVVGAGEIAKYTAVADWLGCQNDVIFTGPLNNPQPWYGAADIFVLPTYYDPSSNATLEALACGLPVITTQLNGMSELMEGKECGVILDTPLEMGAFVAAAMKLADEQVRIKMGIAARNIVASHSIEDYLKETVSIYYEIIEMRRRVHV